LIPNIPGLQEALHVTQPDPERASNLQLFGQFIGSWDLQWAGHDVDGEPVTAIGELHFGWVLGGRAVQDIWIVPGRGQPGEGQPPLAFHGTTIRFFDDDIGAWRSTWINPVTGRVRRFIGRPDGNDVILICDEETPWLRWKFTDIAPDSFRWQGEYSHDAGITWELDDVMLATSSQPPTPQVGSRT
jgi:hypothetical protein